MIPDNRNGQQKRLLKLFGQLAPAERDTLEAFAEFLAVRGKARDNAPPANVEPQPIPRPARESVVGAIKRLSATYPMLDKSRMLNQTSSLMTQHVMQGRRAAEVIDDLERLFADQYEQFSGRDGAGS